MWKRVRQESAAEKVRQIVIPAHDVSLLELRRQCTLIAVYVDPEGDLARGPDLVLFEIWESHHR